MVKRGLSLFYRLWVNPQRFLVGTFALLIGIGTLLLSLPFAHAKEPIGVLDALFTSTSAVCVTGLVVRDTGQDFTRAGQIVILLLIQLGGLGIMTCGAFFATILGERWSTISPIAWPS